MNILSIDPGLQTGSCQFLDGVTTHEEIPYPDVYLKLDKIISNSKFDFVVCESFFITMQTAKKSRADWSLKIIGAIEMICLRENIKLIMQSPSDAKNFSTDKRLKELGMWFPSKGMHCVDSYRHLVLFLFRNYPKEILK